MSVRKISLTSPLTVLKGVGSKTEELYRGRGIETIGDLLEYYPRGYDYYTEKVTVDALLPDQVQAVRLVIIGNASTVRAGGYQITNFRAGDETGNVRLLFYNMPYLARTIRAGSIHVFRGMVRRHQNGNLQIEQPSIYTPADYESLSGTFQPLYHLTKGMKNGQVARFVRKALDECGVPTDEDPSQRTLPAENAASSPSEAEVSETGTTGPSAGAVRTGDACCLPPDFIPPADLAKLGLMEERLAARRIHFPVSDADITRARNRKVFDEFYAFLLGIRREKNSLEKITIDRPLLPVADTQRLIERLPYRLTASQERAWDEIREDLCGKTVMNRLLQGDVGSGKTILAFLSLLLCAANGRQGLLMVPTEVLALQHWKDLSDLTERYQLPVRPVLLTGSVTGKSRKETLAAIADGSANVVIGTHALIQEKVLYQDVALVITDEQHRFGVRQRETLAGKGPAGRKSSAGSEAAVSAGPAGPGISAGIGDSAGPGTGAIPNDDVIPNAGAGTESKRVSPVHVLVMSATPIPRTLSLILYGDLRVSRLTELPADRLPVRNLAAPSSERGQMYAFILRQIEQGRQAYVICPAVEESEEEGLQHLQNVTDYTANLRRSLPETIRIEALTGRMKPAEKNRIMTAFERHDIDILVSTTVIEVGINVPNATCMLIENAERFGLSQLHQLRGRVGRGRWQSYCMFLYSNTLREKPERLAILEKTNDGFRIAEEDLKLRGPGDIYGVRQSGAMGFRLADIYEDADLLVKASDYVDAVIQRGLPEEDSLQWIRSVDFRSI